ncbi:pectate lyase 2 [Pyrus ussuriensis x Pyrus communis]|uniref:Pectate lyase n=1 Tax=Pyrus ussuriensis x Pyrus communis TaxID=2448454 RepID=A0A5N5F2L9_9ROSA|nr:pectate lyase 2 [Pyrus ussuriensis x Pyrus communis]
MASLAPHVLSLLCFLTYIAPTFQAYSPDYSTTPKITLKNIMNVVDSCWRTKSNWATNRRALADCAVGFGKDALGGKYGLNPKPGSLRYGVIQTQPLWIVFAKDMVITLKNELIMNSFKTIDGRGAKVEIAYGPCITVTPTHIGKRRGCDGDAIAVFASSHVWIDHCFLARSADGLLDVTHASTAVTITNNYFSQHDKVMLLEKKRVRFGYAHVANNRYDEWKMYAVGGSANPTIFSEGNYFIAPETSYAKQVTKREAGGSWNNWKWRSSGDVFKNGAFFVQSGYGSCYPLYSRKQSFKVSPGAMVPALTSNAGPLGCIGGKAC